METFNSSKLKLLKLEEAEKGAIWILTINNPPANALSIALFDELEISFDAFANDKSARVLILTGEGKRAFSSGADINVIMSIQSSQNGISLARRGQKLCNKIENIDKPVIAAINAMCIGGGNEIAMACHVRISSERAKFGQPEVNIGIIPGFGGTQRLSRLIGVSKARKLILTGDIISAQQALSLGLVDDVVPADKVVSQSFDLAKRIIRNSPASVQLAQHAIREGRLKNQNEGMEVEIECFGKVCESEDMIEALSAFKEKRPPQFKRT